MIIPFLAQAVDYLCELLLAWFFTTGDRLLESEATLRVDHLYNAIAKETSLSRVERISAYHAQAMTIYTLIVARISTQRRQVAFAKHFDNLLHSYSFPA
jgi:hypothetical protein